MKIALAQINPTVGDFSGNLEKIVEASRRAAAAGARLTVFSELVICGYPPADFLEKPSFLARCRQAVDELSAATGNLPTAVMCSNDMTAIGVLHKAYRVGLRVPDDLSVIGFDNIHITQMTIPPLTTIQMSCYELARAAVMALRAHVEPDLTPERSYPIETQLVVRESTGFPRGSMLDPRTK